MTDPLPTDIHELFGSAFDCPCGRRHEIAPAELVYADDVTDRVPEVCDRAVTGGGRRVAVAGDARTQEVAGRSAAAALEADGWHVTRHVVPDPSPGGSPVCDDRTEAALDAALPEIDMVLAVGSGVINDLCKWLAADRDVPYVCLATAASMTGYTSANVAATIRGVKSLVRARPPAAVMASRRVLAAAPPEMTASGLGDAVAKTTSNTDWRLNHLVFDDYLCEAAVRLLADREAGYLDRPEALRRRDPAAMDALFEVLLLTGVAMTMAGTSAPASGAEHLVSHTLDMMDTLDGRGHDLHGRQVGVGTVLAAEVYRRVLAVESPEPRKPAEGVDREFWGRLADEVSGQWAEKHPRLETLGATLGEADAWDCLRGELTARVRSPEEVRDCLARAGAAVRAEDIGCSRERLMAALQHAPEMRSRVTVLDVAALLGILPEAAGEIVERWA